MTETRYVKIAPKTIVVVGSLAGTLQPHRFVPDAHTGSSCLACFAACDAAQHLGRSCAVRLPKAA